MVGAGQISLPPFPISLHSCAPQQNVLFLKTHKTGSSTLTNILNRYADLRELTIALPALGWNRFRWPAAFHWRSVDRYLLNGQSANILSNHARYNRATMELIMQEHTKYITILRNPVDHFESTFNYMEFHRYFRLPKHPQSLEKFLAQPFAYLYDLKSGVKRFPESLHLVRNGMLFDLGLDMKHHDNDTAVKGAIKKIEKDFSLVLMTDHFDESLVLLKREFCWDLDDILYVKHNQQASSNKISNEHKNSLKDAIRRWNWADTLLYEHFYKIFWEKVRTHGEGFEKDLRDFRKKNRQMHRECIASENVTEAAFGTSGKIQGFKLNENASSLCKKIVRSAIDYIEYFRWKFHPGYRQQLVNEGSVEPSLTDKLRQRFTALNGARQTRVNNNNNNNNNNRRESPVPMPFELG